VHAADPSPFFQADLSILPQEMRDDLSNAVLRLESMHISEVIDRVAQYDAQLGEVLSRAVERLEYTPILKALERSNARLRA